MDRLPPITQSRRCHTAVPPTRICSSSSSSPCVRCSEGGRAGGASTPGPGVHGRAACRQQSRTPTHDLHTPHASPPPPPTRALSSCDGLILQSQARAVPWSTLGPALVYMRPTAGGGRSRAQGVRQKKAGPDSLGAHTCGQLQAACQSIDQSITLGLQPRGQPAEVSREAEQQGRHRGPCREHAGEDRHARRQQGMMGGQPHAGLPPVVCRRSPAARKPLQAAPHALSEHSPDPRSLTFGASRTRSSSLRPYASAPPCGGNQECFSR